MQTNEKGVHRSSEIFFLTPSAQTKELLYYTTRCGHYICNSQYSFDGSSRQGKSEARKNILLMYICRGSMSLVLEGKQYHAHKNQIVAVDCSRPHQYWADEDLEFFWIHMDGVNTREFYNKFIVERGCVFHVVKTNAFYNKFLDIVNSCRPTIGFGELVRSQMLYSLLCMIYNPDSTTESVAEDSSLMGKAVQYIEDHLHEKLNVEVLASVIGLSASHFSREFRKVTGYAPHEYIVMKRIDYAQWLLYSTDDSIGEIAFKTGYNSDTNFIVSFRKSMGISPSRFRKLTQANRQN